MVTAPSSTLIQPDNYRFLQEHVRIHSGIVIDADKHYLFEARLLPIAREQGVRTLDDLCARLRRLSDASLRHRVVEAMTTNETFFFRESAHFDVLRHQILPPLIKARKTTKRLSCWSAASSTGQEAYSIAMLLAEMGLDDWSISITGTDLASKVVERARTGQYSQLEINRGLPASLLVKYFDRQGSNWNLKAHLKKRAHFEQFDLRSSMRGFGPFDVVFCRNVLIYFDAETKSKIIEGIHGTLSKGGHLFLGASEVSFPPASKFWRRSYNDVVYYEAR